MTIVIIAAIPLILLTIYIYMKISESKDNLISSSYSTAGGKAEEAFASIKTVKQFNAEAFHAN
jgi:ABC-type bacteriocin/lantibiotic exporter with double-glycine peptidase domain